MVKIGVVGAGSWGTALANHMALKGLAVDLWVREEDVYRQIKEKRINETFLPGITLSNGIRPVQSFEDVSKEKNIVLIVVPSHFFRDILIKLSPFISSSKPLVVGTKGIENDTLMTMSQVVHSVLPEYGSENFACLSGPSFAREVCQERPTAVTIASRNHALAKDLQVLFSTDYFRVYTTRDVIGVELAGALKNVIAIAAGVSDGLGFGSNTRAALITRGSAEIARLGVSLGADPVTFAGLAGIGDLILTCTGDLSRNRLVGLKIAEGVPVEKIISGMKMVAEGIKTSLSAYNLARKMGIEMPITTEVYNIIYQGKDPREAVKDVMTRKLKEEPENYRT
ncbi:MAG: NAD(P)-dependent glycerol-3-phosphate dehydrogenase [Deltaproteobacteria bacterium]|nr:NAD(P)-dependent glycerol-3-phosphate dehydrogenase [Deltaproteobacteria bacterium]MBW2339496.1 NAD(P)-dependent glycerol-3-phosphate dehydrogenase [Deltaproteobacteria bacterium]